MIKDYYKYVIKRGIVCFFSGDVANIQKKRGLYMQTFYYIVDSIEGDYANLRRTDIESDELKLVALALLPPNITEGCTLKYEMMQYFME